MTALVLLIAQLTPALPAPVPVVVSSDLSAATIAMLTTAIVTVVGALAGGIVSIIKALHETRATVAETKRTVEHNAEIGRQAGEKRDRKLDTIEVLVDGRYSEVLQELADVKLLLAKESGRRADHEQADSAQRRADSQHDRVAKATTPSPLAPDATAAPVRVEVVNQPLAVVADKEP